jgi:hypothetical protein
LANEQLRMSIEMQQPRQRNSGTLGSNGKQDTENVSIPGTRPTPGRVLACCPNTGVANTGSGARSFVRA